MPIRKKPRTSLEDFLTAAQKRQYKLHHYIDVVSNRGHTWRVHLRTPVSNIQLLKINDSEWGPHLFTWRGRGKEIRFHLSEGYFICAAPDARDLGRGYGYGWMTEAFIGQILALTHDEDLILSKAYP